MRHDEGSSNPSANRSFHDVLEARLSRREVMAGSLAVAATSFLAGSGLALAAGKGGPAAGKAAALMGFRPVAVAEGNGPIPTISADYTFEVLIPWGEPLVPRADASGRRRRALGTHKGMLAINHEFGENPHVLGKNTPESLEDVRVSQHAHGVSVVAIENIDGHWRTVSNPNTRRIHVNTPVEFSGPVAGHPLLDNLAGNEPAGTVNNCANGYTPWGTYLSCEENFNGYFGANGTFSPTPGQARYGFSVGGFGYGWHLFDPRFDLSDPGYANEQHRFGWVVEIDPFDGSRKPVKRTALGRFKHEGATFAEGQGGRAVVYMGDDERFDYIYKYVSADNWRSMLARGVSPLDEGTLYVARFDDDGSGEWIELSIADPRLAARFADQAEVLAFARAAADLLGATPMDRPEWSTVAADDMVYFTLTNNSRRTLADAANPLAPNRDGHIIRFMDGDRRIGTSFSWDLFLIARDTHGTEDSFSSPDGIWADPEGRILIETDGGQQDGLNNQLLVADMGTREIRRLLTGVTGDEITGIAVTPDRRTLFVNTQHPGEGNPAWSNFPATDADGNFVFDGVTIPRDCTLVIRRKDGGIIGS